MKNERSRHVMGTIFLVYILVFKQAFSSQCASKTDLV